MTRNDVHRPSEIKPEDYEWVAVEYMRTDDIASCGALQEERRRIREHMASTGHTYSQHAHGGNCMVCGNVLAIYTHLFYHAKSGSYVRMGGDCAAKCEMGDAGAFKRIVDYVKGEREARAGKAKAEGILREAGLTAAWEMWQLWDQRRTQQQTQEEVNALSNNYWTITDMVNKLIRYGSMSEKQINYVRILLEREANMGKRKAEREAEKAAAKPAREGRFTVDATVIKVEYRDNPYAYRASRRVMVVKVDGEGWLAWGTAPEAAERNDRIRLTAEFTRSDRDEKFAFFKRPKVEVLEQAKQPEHAEAA